MSAGATTVLHLDDDEALLRLVEDVFEQAAPELDYVPSPDPDDALGHLEEFHPPVMLLMDRRIPGLDLWSFVKRAEEKLDVVAVPVFILSGSEDPQAVAEAYGNGAVGYLEKPPDADGFYELAELLQRFARLATFPPART